MRTTAVAQSQREGEKAFKDKLLQELKKHASFAHKIVTGSRAALNNPVAAMQDLAKETSK